MTEYRPTQIFASISTKPEDLPKVPQAEEKLKNVKGNVIQVSATGEMSLQPDKCKVTAALHSRKDTVHDAQNSVSRRFDYILQSLHNHQVKVCCSVMFTKIW